MKYFWQVLVLQIPLMIFLGVQNVSYADNHENFDLPTELNKINNSIETELNKINNSIETELNKINNSIEKNSTKIEEFKLEKQINNISNDVALPIKIKNNWLDIFGHIFVVLLPIVVGYLITKRFNQKEIDREKKRLTIELWKYWDSEEMRYARTETWRIFRVNVMKSVLARNGTLPKEEFKESVAEKTAIKLYNFYEEIINDEVPQLKQLNQENLELKKKITRLSQQGTFNKQATEKKQQEIQEIQQTIKQKQQEIQKIQQTIEQNQDTYPKNKEEADKIILLLRITDFFDRLYNLNKKESINPELVKYYFNKDYQSWETFFNTELKTKLKEAEDNDNIKREEIELSGTVEKVIACKDLCSLRESTS